MSPVWTRTWLLDPLLLTIFFFVYYFISRWKVVLLSWGQNFINSSLSGLFLRFLVVVYRETPGMRFSATVAVLHSVHSSVTTIRTPLLFAIMIQCISGSKQLVWLPWLSRGASCNPSAMTRISHRMKVSRENLQTHIGWVFSECEYKPSNLTCQMNRWLVFFTSMPLVSPCQLIVEE